MIKRLTIHNFTIVEKLSIDFSQGMTAVTGETGAGKSVVISAFSLCLGARVDAKMIRHGAVQADITAYFSLNAADTALRWLADRQLSEGTDCVLRRIINQDGRSKAMINDRAVSVSLLREIGQKLIHVYGQHEHQLLLKSEYQQTLLNHYMAEPNLLAEMKRIYSQWKSAYRAFVNHEKQCLENQANFQLLQYQLQELDEFAPIAGEFEKIDEEYKRLANSEKLIHLSQQTAALLAEQEECNALALLNKAKFTLQDLIAFDNSLTDAFTLLENAAIQIAEANDEICHYADKIDCDPKRVMSLEARLAKHVSLARKHQVKPEALADYYQKKLQAYASYERLNEENGQLKQQIDDYHQKAKLLAKRLHQKRLGACKRLAKLMTESMQELLMTEGKFDIAIDYAEDKLRADGADNVTFLVSTNSGQPMQPLVKVASGGELSRLALAMQALTVPKVEMPILIFDEIDVGISGFTAAKVGNLLRKLGLSTQVITVTHLPQVAGCAHEHFFVNKQSYNQKTEITIAKLDNKKRIVELARLLAGDKITDNTLANARELFVDCVF